MLWGFSTSTTWLYLVSVPDVRHQTSCSTRLEPQQSRAAEASSTSGKAPIAIRGRCTFRYKSKSLSVPEGSVAHCYRCSLPTPTLHTHTQLRSSSSLLFVLQLPDLKDAEAVQKFFLEEIQQGEELLAQGNVSRTFRDLVWSAWFLWTHFFTSLFLVPQETMRKVWTTWPTLSPCAVSLSNCCRFCSRRCRHLSSRCFSPNCPPSARYTQQSTQVDQLISQWLVSPSGQVLCASSVKRVFCPAAYRERTQSEWGRHRMRSSASSLTFHPHLLTPPPAASISSITSCHGILKGFF